MRNRFLAIVAATTMTLTSLAMPDLGITTTASAASSTSATYTQSDLNRLISAHDKYIAKYGSNAYLYYVSSETIMRNYVKEVQIALNFLANYYAIDDDTVEDGYYGSDSRKLCREVQQSLNIRKDSYFGVESYTASVTKLKQIIADSSVVYYSNLNFQSAYNYAKTYWNTRNGAYNYYSGNNCANFCSQIMEAAGVPTTNSWKNGTYSYVNVDGLRSYFEDNYSVSYISNPSSSSIKPGDIIYTNNGGHVMFVMEVSSRGVVYASGNTNNRDCISVSASCISGVLKTSALF